jgi:hypothetical protein
MTIEKRMASVGRGDWHKTGPARTPEVTSVAILRRPAWKNPAVPAASSP